MSVGFSTIRPMSQETISKASAYSVNDQAAQQPAANSPMVGPAGRYQPKKKSNWFAKTLVTLAVLAAAVGLGRKYMPNTFNPDAVLKDGANLFEKGAHYVTKYIGKAGEFINTNVAKAYNWVTNLFKKDGKAQNIDDVAEELVEVVG